MKKLWAVLAGIATVLAFLFGYFFKAIFNRKANTMTSREKSEEVRREIENTPAVDLVAAAPNAEQLRANTAGIAERAKQQYLDRVRSILFGNTGTGTD